MLELTLNAVEVVRSLAAPSATAGVRIYSEPRAGDGWSLSAALVELPGEDDAVVEEEGARIYMDPRAAAALDDKVLDTYVEDGRVHLALLERP